jgi:hypothetical protein
VPGRDTDATARNACSHPGDGPRRRIIGKRQSRASFALAGACVAPHMREAVRAHSDGLPPANAGRPRNGQPGSDDNQDGALHGALPPRTKRERPPVRTQAVLLAPGPLIQPDRRCSARSSRRTKTPRSYPLPAAPEGWSSSASPCTSHPSLGAAARSSLSSRDGAAVSSCSSHGRW